MPHIKLWSITDLANVSNFCSAIFIMQQSRFILNADSEALLVAVQIVWLPYVPPKDSNNVQ